MAINSETVVLSPQAHAMVAELIKIGVHGSEAHEVIENLVLDQLKYLCTTPGFRTLVDVAYDAGRKIEADRRSRKTESGGQSLADCGVRE